MKTIITIGRQYGSAGHSIGKILADDLGIKYYDKELLERAAKDSGLCQELFENHDEKPTNSFLYSLVMDSYSFGYGSTMMDMPLNQKVFLAQFDAIKKISQDGPCVIVGRCADYALEENPNVLSIFIKADMQVASAVSQSCMIFLMQKQKTRSQRSTNSVQATTITTPANAGAR